MTAEEIDVAGLRDRAHKVIDALCDCGDFDGHPGDCAATRAIVLFAALLDEIEAGRALRAGVEALAEEYAERSTDTEASDRRYPWGVAGDDLRALLAGGSGS